MPPLLAALGPDTRNHVLSFLPLSDCLRYSQASKQSLLDAIPNLKQRRTEQFLERRVYNPERLISIKNIPSLETNADLNFLQPLEHDGQSWHLLPSVAERVEGMYRALPQTHFGKDLARELMLDLQEDRDEEDDIAADFPTGIDLLRSYTKAHRLHDHLLSQSTLHCNPPNQENVHDDMAMTVTLDQYMGDVLIAYYLMAHSIADLIEGNSNHDYSQWAQRLESDIQTEHQSATPKQGYRQWIYIHSTLLRTLPMQTDWLARMKLFPICGITCTTPTTTSDDPTSEVECMIPPFPFMEQITTTRNLLRTLAGPAPRILWRNSTRVDDFGPLGPAFRGRDRVRILDMNPGRLLRHVGTYNSLYCLCDSVPIVVINAWLQQSEEEASWMLNLSTECYRSRPMSVLPPMVMIATNRH